MIDCSQSAPPHSTLECCPTSPFIQLVPVDVAWCRCLIREYFTGAPRAENTLQLLASCLQPGHRRDFSEIFPTWPVNFRRWRIFTFTPGSRLRLSSPVSSLRRYNSLSNFTLEKKKKKKRINRSYDFIVSCLPIMLQTALHWAAKHGDENIVKLIAGTYKDYIKSVNETSVSDIEMCVCKENF